MTITKLLGNRIVIRRIEEPETTASRLIFLPRRARGKGQTFEADVVLLGSGPKVPGQVKIGDRVTLEKTGSHKLGDGTEIVSTLDILGIHDADLPGPPEREESYTPAEIENAITIYLRRSAEDMPHEYPVLGSWAEKVLHWHLKQLEAKRANP